AGRARLGLLRIVVQKWSRSQENGNRSWWKVESRKWKVESRERSLRLSTFHFLLSTFAAAQCVGTTRLMIGSGLFRSTSTGSAARFSSLAFQVISSESFCFLSSSG